MKASTILVLAVVISGALYESHHLSDPSPAPPATSVNAKPPAAQHKDEGDTVTFAGAGGGFGGGSCVGGDAEGSCGSNTIGRWSYVTSCSPGYVPRGTECVRP